MRKHLLLGFIVAGVCMYFAFRGISFAGLFSSLRHADPLWLLIACLIYSCGFIFRTLRWKLLLRPLVNASSREVIGPLVIGFFANNVLPFRMGELIRAQVAGKKLKISRTASLGTILLERLYDTVCFLGIFIAVTFVFPFPKFVEKGAFLLAGSCVGIGIVLFLISRHEARFYSLLDRSSLRATWKAAIRHTVGNFVQGVAGMSNLSMVVKALALSVPVWMVEGSFLYAIGRSFHLPLSYTQAYFMLFFTGLSVTVPQAPGSLGTFEWFGVTALTLLGIPKDLGLPMVLAVHGIQFLMIGIAGLTALSLEKMSFADLFHTAKTRAEI